MSVKGRTMKRVLIGLGVVVVLLIAALFIVPSLIDWNAYRDDIAAEVEKATGRRLEIAGDVSLTLLPSPAFSAENIRLANDPDSQEPVMVSLERVSVDVALFPLIGGDVKVESIVLTRPVILLESYADGTANWNFETPPSQPGDGGSGDGGTQLSLDSLAIEDGTVIYRAPDGSEERIENLDAKASAGTLNGPFQLAGTATVRGLPSELSIGVGDLESGGPTPIKLTMRLPDSNAELLLDGRVDLAGEAPGFQGSLTASGTNLAAAMTQLGGSANLPPLLGQNFELLSQLALDGQSFAARDLSLALGPSRGTGEVVYTLGDAPTVIAKLNFPQLNLDELIAQATPPGANLPEAQTGAETAPDDGAPATLLPPGLTGTVELGVGQLTYRGQIVQDVAIAADFADDKATLRDIAMQLPGPSTLALSGEVALSNGAPAFVGRLELASDRLRDLLTWVGVDVASVPADRLGRFDLATDVDASGRQVSLSDLAIELDSTRASGGLVLALGERPGIGLGLAVDRLNVDAYMPAGGGGATTGGGGGGAAGGDPLAAFDANLDLRVGSLTYQGVPVGDVRIVGALQNGTFRFDELKLGVIAGGSLSYAGTLAPAEPRFDGTLTLSTSKPEELAMLAGLDPGMLSQIGSFDLTADIDGTPDDLDVNANLAALGGDFSANGRLTGGTASTLKVTVQHPNVAKLADALGQPGVVPAGFGGIDASTTVALGQDSVSLSDLSGQVGPLAIKRGTLSVGTAGRPRIDADLVTGVIDLGALTDGGGGGSSGGGSSGGGERWSSESLGLEGLRDFDAKVKLAADAIVQGETRIENAVVDLTLEGGLLTIEQLQGVMNGGQLAATGTVDARQTPRLDAQFTLNAMQLAPFFEGAFPVGKPKGVVNATGNIAGDATSMASLMGSLNGAIDAGGRFNLDTGGAGVLGGQGLAVGGEILSGLLGDQAKQLGQIKNVTDGAALLVQALADRDSPFIAQIDLQNGRAQLQQVEVQGRGLTAKAEGFADLAPWTGDILLNVFLNDRPDEPYYQERRVGLLDDPDQVDRSGLLLTGEAPEELPEADAPTPLEEALPEELQGLVPEGTEDLTGQLPEQAQDLVQGLTGGETTEPQAEQPAEQSTEQQAEQPAEQSTEPQAEQPAEQAAEQQAEQSAEQSTEQQSADQQATEDQAAAEKAAAEKAAAEQAAAEQAAAEKAAAEKAAAEQAAVEQAAAEQAAAEQAAAEKAAAEQAASEQAAAEKAAAEQAAAEQAAAEQAAAGQAAAEQQAAEQAAEPQAETTEEQPAEEAQPEAADGELKPVLPALIEEALPD